MPPELPPPDSHHEVTHIDDSRLMATLSYVGILVLIPLLVRRHDPFVYFHAKQGLVIFLGLILATIAARWIAGIGSFLFLLLLVADILGLMQALLGRRWKIPVIGKIAEKFNV